MGVGREESYTTIESRVTAAQSTRCGSERIQVQEAAAVVAAGEEVASRCSYRTGEQRSATTGLSGEGRCAHGVERSERAKTYVVGEGTPFCTACASG